MTSVPNFMPGNLTPFSPPHHSTPNKSRKITNLYYVGGSTTPGIGLPMCLIGAELIYKRLAGDKKGGPVHMVERLVPTKENTL